MLQCRGLSKVELSLVQLLILHQMAFMPSLSPEDLPHYHRVVTHSVTVRSHFDMLIWLQDDMQRYLPHDIMLAAWGDFEKTDLQHDIISPLLSVRSRNADPEIIAPLLRALFSRWVEFGFQAFTIEADDNGFPLQYTSRPCALSEAVKTMRSGMVHGIKDEQANHHCLYIIFSSQASYSERARFAMPMLLPYIDSALRQVTQLPRQVTAVEPVPPEISFKDLTKREIQILFWVALGKTNPEIGKILFISGHTVKNHMQRVFKKLNVVNRAQAVGSYKALVNNV
jgi:transcriptional regulator EpsA